PPPRPPHPHSLPTRRSSDLDPLLSTQPSAQRRCAQFQRTEQGIVRERGCLQISPDRADAASGELLGINQGLIGGLSLDFPEGLKDRKSTRLNSSHDQISYAV